MGSLIAHAAPVSYRFPLPIWIYVLGAGAAVLASAPAALVGVRSEGRAPWRSRDLYPTLRRWRLGPTLLAVTTILLVWALVGALVGTGTQAAEFFENPLTVIIWIDFWVGLGLVSAFVGDVWDFVSPLNAGARALDRALARRNVAPLAYPARLGRWPAVILLLVWSWCELVWPAAKEPRTLAAMVLGYIAATLIGSALVGAEAWLGNVELFTVVARTFARFAPTELDPDGVEEWLARPPEERHVRLRAYGAGIRSGDALPAGGPAFVLALLATVVFDGFSQTNRYAIVQSWFLDRWSWFGAHDSTLDTLLMLIIVTLFVLAFLAICALTGEGAAAAGRRYAPTLIPIAAVYFAAHYWTYLVVYGQTTLGVLVDPFGRSWNPGGLGEYAVWKGIPAALIWWSQVLLIVWGHVEAIFAAHRIALDRERSPTAAVRAQAPMIALMVAYTMAGLWVLAQQIKVGA